MHIFGNSNIWRGIEFFKVILYISHMEYIVRSIERELQKAAKHFAALIITGPRRAGKTTILQQLFPHASYLLLEDPDVVARVRSDPRGVLNELRPPVILDEIQNTPELLNYVRSIIDENPAKKGRWFITGSQEAPLMKGVTESMAGRAAIFSLFPISITESPKVTLFRGGFPEVILNPDAAHIWYRSYIQTYLERDVRAISDIRDIATFRRFLALVASRCGRILNKTDLASSIGVSVPTITQWLNILEVTGQILFIPPFFENFGKRLIKSPKLYFVDSGLSCHLLGLDSEKMLHSSTFLGPLFEGFAASEIIKHRLNAGKQRGLYYFRDQQGLEVDFIVHTGGNRLVLAEVKTGKTALPDMAAPLDRLAGSIKKYEVQKVVIYRPIADKTAAKFVSLKPETKAVSLPQALTMMV